MSTELLEIVGAVKKTLRLIERPEKFMLFLASFLMLLTGVLTNFPALILGRLVDQVVGANVFEFSVAIPFLELIILTILFREILTVIRKYLIENTATQTEKKQTVAVINHLLHADIETIHGQQIGALHGRIFRSIQGLVRIIKLGFLDFLPVFFAALAALVIAFLQKPLIASVMILVIPTSLYIIIKQISSQKGIRVALLRGKEKIDGIVVEMLSGIETIRVANTADKELKKIEQVAEELRSKEIRHHIFMALFDSGKYLNEGFFYILVIALSILFSSQGVISKGDILVYSILFLSITGPLREIHRILDEAHESSIRVSDLYILLGLPADESFTKVNGGRVRKTGLAIFIKNLSFSYPSRSGKILKDVDLEIRTGEKIGIVGPSGCGKSTLIKILLRLLHKYEGEISFFGKDLKNVSREEIAEKVAYVPQNTYIFSGTITENLIYGTPSRKISQASLILAAKKAGIYDEIIRTLGGFDGVVTENGNNLSGGQKQRLAIARLILKSPELFIFDEATSALDNTNEAIIQRNIEQLFADKIMITIAHRLTTLKNVDRILVFDKGMVVQEGKFEELSKKPGLFQDFLNQKQR